MERGEGSGGAWRLAPPQATPSGNVPSGIVERSVGGEGKQGAPREHLSALFLRAVAHELVVLKRSWRCLFIFSSNVRKASRFNVS